MTNQKLLKYLAAAVADDETVLAEQCAEIQQSIKRFSEKVETLAKDRNFAAIKKATLDFIEEQDGVGCDDGGGGSGLLGDADVVRIAADFLVRRQKSFDEAVRLLGIAYQKAR